MSLVFVDVIRLDYYNNDHPGKDPSNSMAILNAMLRRPFHKIGSSIESGTLISYLKDNFEIALTN